MVAPVQTGLTCLNKTARTPYVPCGRKLCVHRPALQEAEVVALPRIIAKRWPGAGVEGVVNAAVSEATAPAWVPSACQG